MAAALLIEPDGTFIKDVIASGGADLKKCMQCATCSAACTLAPEDAPFPRAQMIAAQWGLKDRLVADPAIWLCHNCGQCTEQCPRGARPGDVFGAIRRQAIKTYGAPGVLARAVASPKALLLLLLLPVLVFAAIALWAPKHDANPAAEFADVFPIPALEALFFTVAGLALAAFAAGMVRFIRALRASGAPAPILPNLAPALAEILVHRRFTNCAGDKARCVGHMLTLWGFIGLAIMGTAAGIGTMTGLMTTPLPLANPWKIYANVCAGAMLAGVAVLLAGRITDPARRAASTYFDWFFLLTLSGVVLTGVVSEAVRLMQWTQGMYAVYFVHLVLIFSLFLYAPYSKFAHLAYRTVAIAAARGGKRNSS